jgi:hypothetical protein
VCPQTPDLDSPREELTERRVSRHNGKQSDLSYPLIATTHKPVGFAGE